MKRYLITGATGGIGTPLCHRLVEAGAELVLAGRNRSAIERLIADLDAANPRRFHALDLDMADRGSVARFAAALAKADLHLDGAVVMPPQPARTNQPLPEPEDWDVLFNGSFTLGR